MFINTCKGKSNPDDSNNIYTMFINFINSKNTEEQTFLKNQILSKAEEYFLSYKDDIFK